MARVLIFGAAWTVCVAALVVAMGIPMRQASSRDVPAAVSLPAPPAPLPRVGARYPGWTVTRAYSAHRMMVVEVEADAITRGTAVAAQVVEPLKARYDEVLIYVREPGQSGTDLAARRIQWTRRDGYVELTYGR